jgi:beta-glucanase (GH16 family)
MLSKFLQGGCLLLFLQAAAFGYSNLLLNAGFEFEPIGQTSSINGWHPFGGNAYGETGSPARSGSNYFKVYQAFNGQQNVTGVYQDYISGPGAVYSAEGYAYVNSADLIAGGNAAWIEVTFRDATANILALYKSTTLTPALLNAGTFPQSAWTLLGITNNYNPATQQLTGTVTCLTGPAGTSFVRYQITFLGDAANSKGSAYFDDLSLTQIACNTYGTNWNITWNDEFNGSSINPSVWTYDIGNGGWGNNELEYYTSSSQNSYVLGGALHIVARKQSMGGSSYTSARMKSQSLYSRAYGRLEWRAKLPQGAGFWPALWLLGTNITSVGWPNCGEIDVVENSGANPGFVQGSLHSSNGDATSIFNFINDGVTNFHTYVLEWTTNNFNFFVDGSLYESQHYSAYPFNQRFFFIMNLAIGGNYVGNPSQATINSNTFPAEMQVDYVRAYEQTSPLQLTTTITGGIMKLSWPSNIVSHLQMSSLSLSGTWTDLTGAADPYTVPKTNSAAFFRLVSP